MARVETKAPALPQNRKALADLNGQWIDLFHDRNGLKYIVLDIGSSVSPSATPSADCERHRYVHDRDPVPNRTKSA